MSGDRVSDASILSPEERHMAKTITWGITGGRSWVTGLEIEFDDTALHHILHDNEGSTLYGADFENKFNYYVALDGIAENNEMEGMNQKLMEDRFLFMWEQFRAGNFAEANKFLVPWYES